MAFTGSIFDEANNLFYDDPNMGAVLAVYTPTTGSSLTVKLMDVAVPEEQVFGDIRTRSQSAYKTMRISDVSERPKQDETLLFGGATWLIKSAEPDEENLNWMLDLRIKRGG